MNTFWKSKIISFVAGIFVGGVVGWAISTYMDRPDISYYTRINQQAKIKNTGSRKTLTSWNITRRNPEKGDIFSSSVYIRNTGYHAYKGEDFSQEKDPLRIESDHAIRLFAINDKQSPESKISTKDKNGIYYIEIDFLNYGRMVHFIFTHERPVRYIHVKGSGVNLPVIKEKMPIMIWLYRHPILMLLILIFIMLASTFSIFFLLDRKVRKVEEEYHRLVDKYLNTQNEKRKKQIMKQIGKLFKKRDI